MNSINIYGYEISLIKSWAPVAQVYGLPDWVADNADEFTTRHKFSFTEILLGEEHMIVHDSLHNLTHIPPSDEGEVNITQIEMFLSHMEGGVERSELQLLTKEQLKFYAGWYGTVQYPLDVDLAEYLWERHLALKYWIDDKGPLPLQY